MPNFCQLCSVDIFGRSDNDGSLFPLFRCTKSLDFRCINCVHISTAFWGPGNHSVDFRGRPMFLKPKLHKESRNWFKKINYRPSLVMIFSKNCFWGKKSSKKLYILLSFEYLWQNIWINLAKLKKIIFGHSESVEILTKL